jgi:hypothetical protein
MDLGIVSKQPTRNLAIVTVSWSCLGGVEIGNGIQQTLTNYHSIRWMNSFLFGAACVAFGIFSAVTLLRRAKSWSRSPACERHVVGNAV